MKPQKVTTPIYGNFEVFYKDVLMFRTTKKRIDWFLSRNLAEKIDENKISLLFEPKGLGTAYDIFFAMPKENKCVVCGTDKELSRHHIVPSLYRKNFPTSLKEKNPYDIVPLCCTCHEKYERAADKLKQQLATYYNIPANKRQTKEYKSLLKAVSAANVLVKHSDKLPDQVRVQFENIISSFLSKEITKEDVVELYNRKKELKISEDIHGKEIVEQVNDLQEFCEMWRSHFLSHAKPKFMPAHWDVKRPIKLNNNFRTNE